ncbi:MAG: DUF192 domain-containing protein [Minwuia sp.]|nr:DUF192 domain-containing protein [Minwuia sp.]
MMKHLPMRLFLRPVLSLFLLLATVMPAAAQDMTALSVETAGGERRFAVEVADTPATRRRGLMFREAMPLDHGMLFNFERNQHQSFWMKNTPLPLDIIFIDRRGIIVHIHHNAVPYDETPIPSVRPASAVLEVNGGVARLSGIAMGNQVRHAIFGNLAE